MFNEISYSGVIKHQRENANWYEIEKFILLVTDFWALSHETKLEREIHMLTVHDENNKKVQLMF